ncbi:hypothetical protein WR25_03146 [Diploscapter pachys]|uniref:Uncharacterized protein n=1 Tax=Diploscapter pachys TaxID=2018661 RepID=A0A2A2M1K3_9BILA|nr:hypothetical protein WR25_03146 [Diploscapter pachys]
MRRMRVRACFFSSGLCGIEHLSTWVHRRIIQYSPIVYAAELRHKFCALRALLQASTGDLTTRVPSLPQCRQHLAVPVAIDGNLGLFLVSFERIDVKICDCPCLRAARRRENAVLRESAIHGCIDRGLASIRVQRRTPVSSSGRHGLRDEHSVLQCPRHAAHTDPGCTCLGVGTARNQQQAHSRLSLGSHGQWKLTVIANSDAGTHAFQIEHLEFVATLDDAGVFLEPRQLQFVLVVACAVRRKPPSPVAVAVQSNLGQKRTGLNGHAQLARQVGIQCQPRRLQGLQRGQRGVEIMADARLERCSQFEG